MTRFDATAPRSTLDDARAAILGAVTGSLIHSIGQPLTIMRLAAERAVPDAGMDAAAVDVVVDQVTRLETVFQQLDALARAGRGPTRPQPVLPALHDALAVLQPLAAPPGPDVTLSAPPEAADVVVEAPDGLVHLLGVVLLHEALTAARTHVTLTLCTIGQDGRLALHVEDDRPALTPPDWRAAVVAEALGGRVVDPAAAATRGTIYEVPARLSAARATAPGSVQAWAAPAPPAARSRPARVLLVEDELLIADMLADVLDDHGFKVEVCASVTAALDALAAEVPDVVVTDLSLPDHRGEVLLDRLTTDWPQVFTVVMSGRELDRESTGAGAVDLILRKPVATGTLADSLYALLDAAADAE